MEVSTRATVIKGFAARNSDALKQVAKAVDQAGVQVLPLPLDLREPAADKTLVDKLTAFLDDWPGVVLSLPLSAKSGPLLQSQIFDPKINPNPHLKA